MQRSKRHGSELVRMLILLIVVFGGFVTWVVIAASADAPRHDALARQQALEQRADDVSWLILKNAARRHLSAVRSDASRLPDEELGQAMIDYAQNGRRFFRTPKADPTGRLAALKTAAATLDDPARPVRCHGSIRSKDDPRCARYLKALVDVFGRDL